MTTTTTKMDRENSEAEEEEGTTIPEGPDSSSEKRARCEKTDEFTPWKNYNCDEDKFDLLKRNTHCENGWKNPHHRKITTQIELLKIVHRVKKKNEFTLCYDFGASRLILCKDWENLGKHSVKKRKTLKMKNKFTV